MPISSSISSPQESPDTSTRIIVLDVETTGLSHKEGDRIVEIGCIEMIDGQPSGNTFHHYLNPERPIPKEVTQIHGIRDEDVADKPKFFEVAELLLQFLQGATLMAHNANFDIRFLDSEFARLEKGFPSLEKNFTVVDTLSLCRERFGTTMSLDKLCDLLKVDRSGRHYHGALLDAELLASAYAALSAGQMGFEHLDTLLEVDEGGDIQHFHGIIPKVKVSEAERETHDALMQALQK